MINNKLVLSELFVGKKEELFQKIDESTIDEFAKLSGDYSRIHIDRQYAVQKGFRDRVVHGAYIASKFSQLIGTKLPGDTGILLTLNLNFHKAIIVGDYVRFSSVIKSIHHSVETVEIELTASIEEKLICCSGKSLVMVSDKK